VKWPQIPLEGNMFAIIAAILFAIALIFQLAGTTFGTHVSFDTFLIAGLLSVALHLAGVGTGWSPRRPRRR
jgi:hypothetical protein